jgi:hypothetical protein
VQPLWRERDERWIWRSHLQAARSNSSIVGDVEKSYDVSGLLVSKAGKSDMWAIRTVGILLLVAALVCILLIFANWHTASLGGRNLKPLAVPAIAFCLLGVGLLLRRKSAALIAMLGSVAWVSWLLIGTVRTVPMPWSLLNVVFGVLGLIPAAVLVMKWSALNGW